MPARHPGGRHEECAMPMIERRVWATKHAVDGLIVDLDGVVWLGRQPIPGAVAALSEIRSSGLPIVFLTNDPSGSRADYAARLTELGVAATAEEVVTAPAALAAEVRDREGTQAPVFAIGSAALKSELGNAGLSLCEGTEGRSAAVVVVGGHPDFGYEELRISTIALRSGAALYATGRDAVYPMSDGPWPATGAVLAAVETAGGRRAVVVGKPERPIFETARARLWPATHVAVVGDQLVADIAGGKRAGLTTILVLTGATSRSDLAAVTSDGPDLVVPSLADLSRILAEARPR
jgi:glycerol-1-phosphatase